MRLQQLCAELEFLGSKAAHQHSAPAGSACMECMAVSDKQEWQTYGASAQVGWGSGLLQAALLVVPAVWTAVWFSRRGLDHSRAAEPSHRRLQQLCAGLEFLGLLPGLPVWSAWQRPNQLGEPAYRASAQVLWGYWDHQ